MFLYGMRLMGDGLKESSSGTLKKAMESVTNNQFKAFLLGYLRNSRGGSEEKVRWQNRQPNYSVNP